MMQKIVAFLKDKADILERGVWTALQVVSAAAVVEFFELDVIWTVPIAALLAFIKGAIAEHFGNGSAATLPSSVEPMPLMAYDALQENYDEALSVLKEIENFGAEEA